MTIKEFIKKLKASSPGNLEEEVSFEYVKDVTGNGATKVSCFFYGVFLEDDRCVLSIGEYEEKREEFEQLKKRFNE